MNKAIFIITLVLIAIVSFSCKEKSANPETTGDVSFSFLAGKCIGSGLPKAVISDSVFSYFFLDKLAIDFSVSGNCCPDSNRFTVTSNTGTDTIVVAVVDTAQHLCRCICKYMIHAEFGNLPGNHYVVLCTAGVPGSEGEVIHLVDVYRNL